MTEIKKEETKKSFQGMNMTEPKVEQKIVKKPEVKKVEVPKPAKISEIEDLPGVGPLSAEKLRASGFYDIMSIAVASPGQLTQACGFGEAVARKTINIARENLNMGFADAIQIEKDRESVIRISTGVAAFDEMLRGGFETKAIVECFGQYGSSKTQIAHQLCVNVQKQDPTAVAVYIDTEGSFRPSRLREMAKGAGLDEEKVLKNVKVAKAHNSDHQMLLAEKVIDLIKKDKMNIQLVVVDSLIALFRAEFVGRGTLADRQQKINRHMNVLAKLADQHNLCVYVTNQVMSKPDQFFGDPTASVGGHIVGHRSMFRIYLRHGKKGSRVAKLIDAPNLPDGEAPFQVTTDGLKDL